MWSVSTLYDSPLHNILWPILDRLGRLLVVVWTVSLCGGGNLRKHNKYSRKLLSDLFMSLEMGFQQTHVFFFTSATVMQKLLVAVRVHIACTLSSKWEMAFEHVASA